MPFAASKLADLAILMSAACSAVRRFVALGRAAAAKAMRRCYRQLLRPPNPSLSSLLRASKRCTCLQVLKRAKPPGGPSGEVNNESLLAHSAAAHVHQTVHRELLILLAQRHLALSVLRPR